MAEITDRFHEHSYRYMTPDFGSHSVYYRPAAQRDDRRGGGADRWALPGWWRFANRYSVDGKILPAVRIELRV